MNKTRQYQMCINCVMDTTDAIITFDENGMCDHCQNFYNNIKPNWHTDERGQAQLNKMIKRVKHAGRRHDYDCLIGISGGVDSSYLSYLAAEKWGLRPLILTVDVGWNLNVAIENVEKIVRGLGLDMVTEVVNWEEVKDLQRAYFMAQVPYQDIPQDHAIFAAVYNYAVHCAGLYFVAVYRVAAFVLRRAARAYDDCPVVAAYAVRPYYVIQ